MKKPLLTVSACPHLRHEDTACTIMCDVIIALVPAVIWAVYIFGARALIMSLVSVISCVIFDYAARLILKRPAFAGDLSSAVTGILLAFTLPAAAPLWMPVAGAFIAIVIGKQAFGGTGKNFLNPAVFARVVLGFFPSASHYTAPFEALPLFASASSVPQTQQVLDSLVTGVIPPVSAFDMLIGNRVGGVGEVSALLLAAGGVYLLVRRVISLHIPLSFMAAVLAVAYVFPMNTFKEDFMMFQLLSGAVVLGAVFLATDSTTSPISTAGKIIFGAGCGLITMAARYWGRFDGVYCAIIIMNILTPYLDRMFIPRPFGVKKESNKQDKKL